MPRRPRTLLTRREMTVAGAATAAAAYTSPAWAKRLLVSRPQVGPGRFLDGVASGQPAPDAITLWSRLRTEHQRSGARLVVATDEGLRNTVATTVVPTARSVDGALKARIDGLKPDTVYWYKFTSADGDSELGRTKTAKPADSQAPVRLAYSSCQNWPEGFFNGHAEAAKGDPLDLYLFLGDYVYEYGPRSNVRRDDTPTVDLESYRENYAMYRGDKGLRELHRLHPIAHIWDDHEVHNNYSENSPRPADLQRAAGYKVCFEWLPQLPAGGERYRNYTTFPLGRQCEVIMLDQRQYRTGDNDGQPRQLLGRRQLDWFKQRLAASPARWKVVGNQVMFARLGAGGQGVNPDQWDGYEADRAEVLDVIKQRGIDDVMFVTGDIHTYFACQIPANVDSGPSVATEFVGGSVTSQGLPRGGGGPEAAIRSANPWIKLADGEEHGYARLDLSATEARIEFRVGDITREGSPLRDFASFRQPSGANDFERTGGTHPNVGGVVPTPPAPATLRSDRAPTRQLASRRRVVERRADRAAARAERRLRAATDRGPRKARRS